MSSSDIKWKQLQVGCAGDGDIAGEQQTCPCASVIYQGASSFGSLETDKSGAEHSQLPALRTRI